MLHRYVLPALLFVAQPVQACTISVEMELKDIFSADAVVTGQVSDYEIVEVGDRGPLADYARITFRVDDVIAGDLTGRMGGNNLLTITWDNSTFGEPETLGEGDGYNRFPRLLIALRDPASPGLPLRSGSGVILPSPEPEQLTVLQAPCSSAFIFRAGDPYGVMLQQVLETDHDPELVMDILLEFIRGRGAFSSLEREVLLLERERDGLRRQLEQK